MDSEVGPYVTNTTAADEVCNRSQVMYEVFRESGEP